MGVIVEHVDFVADTSLTTPYVQRISLPSNFTSAPKLIRVVVSGATSDGSTVAESRFSEGWYDGSSSWVIAFRADSGGTTGDADCYGTTSADTVGVVIDPTSQVIDDYCQFEAWGTDGGVGYVDIEWTGGAAAPSAAYRCRLTAYTGSDFEGEIGVEEVDAATQSVNTEYDVSLSPSGSTLHPAAMRFHSALGLTLGAGNNYIANGVLGGGWAVSDQDATPSFQQFAHGIHYENASLTPDQGQTMFNSEESGGTARCLARGDEAGTSTANMEWELTDTQAGQWSYTIRNDVSDLFVGWVVMDFGGTIPVGIGYHEQMGSLDPGYSDPLTVPVSAVDGSGTFGPQAVDWVASDFAATGYQSGNLSGSVNPYCAISASHYDDGGAASITVGSTINFAHRNNDSSRATYNYHTTSEFIEVIQHNTGAGSPTVRWNCEGTLATTGVQLANYDNIPSSTTKVNSFIAFGVNSLTAEGDESLGLTDAGLTAGVLARAGNESLGLTDAVEKLLTAVGTDYLKGAADTEGLVDAALAALALARAVGEDLSLADAAAAALTMARAIGDSEGLADAAAAVLALARSVEETEGLADEVGRVLTFARAGSDSLGLAEIALSVLALGRAAGDVEGATDAALRALAMARSGADTEGLSDDAARAITAARAGSDIEGLADAALSALVLARDAGGAESLADAAEAALALARAATGDTEGLADEALSALGKARAAGDSIGLAEEALAALGKARAAAETEGLSDAAVAAMAFLRAAEDVEGLADAASAALSLRRAGSDSEGLSDAAARVLAAARAGGDAEGLTDAAVRLLALARAASGDDLGLADAAYGLIATSGILKATAETEGLSDAAVALLQLGGLADDTEGLLDAAVRVLTGARSGADTEGLSDDAGRALSYFRAVADVLGSSDQALPALGLARAIGDAAGIAEVALAVLGIARAASDTLGLSDEAVKLLSAITITQGVQSLRLEVGDPVSLQLDVADNLSLRSEVGDPVSLRLDVHG